jgi:hypothetical protein
MTSSSSPAFTTLAVNALGLWKVSLVPGYQEVSVSPHSTGDELIVIRMRRDAHSRDRIHPLASPTERAQRGIDLVSPERKPGPKKDRRVLGEDLVRETRHDQPLVYGQDRKASLPSAEIIADTRTSVSTTARITFASRAGRLKFQRRFRARRASLLRPAPGFRQPIGRRRCDPNKVKSCTLRMTTAGSPRRSATKRSLFSTARSMIWPNWVRARWASTRRFIEIHSIH